MAGTKRRQYALTDQGARVAAERISKARWIELYADLYRQVFGEHSGDGEITRDAYERSTILDYAYGTRSTPRYGAPNSGMEGE